MVWLGVFLPLVGCATGDRGASGFSIKRSGALFAPQGSPWTILCLERRGLDRRQLVGQIVQTLKRTPGIRADKVVVLDDADDVARLYYGVYYRSLDPKTGKRTTPQGLIRDLELIRELATPKGQRFFLMARTVRVPTPDVGNPAWALSNLDAAYSLQVAVFEGTDDFWDFKQVAADYCAHLRKRGYEAYYHHASASSMITVGAFGEDAVRIPPTGLPYYSPEVIAMQQDEILKYNRLNGKIYRARTNTGEKVRVESRLVKIPSGDDGDRW
ncbi:MAG: hypothetical protein IID43_05505 [Planctomycetes bacterium]|nr:hypothetical protein [Planctomycetota bacterium]